MPSPLGRPLKWPEPWSDLAAKVGGAGKLRDAMGYASPTTVWDKVHGRSPWTRADKKLLAFLCKEHDFNFDLLFPQ